MCNHEVSTFGIGLILIRDNSSFPVPQKKNSAKCGMQRQQLNIHNAILYILSSTLSQSNIEVISSLPWKMLTALHFYYLHSFHLFLSYNLIHENYVIKMIVGMSLANMGVEITFPIYLSC